MEFGTRERRLENRPVGEKIGRTREIIPSILEVFSIPVLMSCFLFVLEKNIMRF